MILFATQDGAEAEMKRSHGMASTGRNKEYQKSNELGLLIVPIAGSE